MTDEPSAPLAAPPTAPPASSADPGQSVPRCWLISHLIGRIALRVFGWRLGEVPPPGIPRAVMIAAPHSSNWDMPYMLLVAWAMNVRISWVGKESLFRWWPLARFFAFLGGAPVIRSEARDQVSQIAQRIRDADAICLAISPPGTRARRDHWRSGFYHIALQADVPMFTGYLDFARKVGGIGPVIHPTGHVAEDMDQIRAFYDGIAPLYPELKTPVRLRDESEVARRPPPPEQLTEHATTSCPAETPS